MESPQEFPQRPGCPSGAIVALFPLPDLILFPGVVQPLHIFEPRYRQMTGDLLDGSGHVVMGTVLGSAEMVREPAPVQPLAGLGRVEDYQRLPDGRYVILLRGVGRVGISEVDSDRMYRKVRIELVEETEQVFEDADRCCQRVREATLSRSSGDLQVPERVSLAEITDLLLLQLGLPARLLYDAFAITSVRERARVALDLHSKR